jgi:hypothetical protein
MTIGSVGSSTNAVCSKLLTWFCHDVARASARHERTENGRTVLVCQGLARQRIHGLDSRCALAGSPDARYLMAWDWEASPDLRDVPSA